MARFRLSRHKLGVELGGGALGMHDLPVDDEAQFHLSCPDTAVVWRERQFDQLPLTSIQDLMCCRDDYGL
jgi:hypothetical protein